MHRISRKPPEGIRQSNHLTGGNMTIKEFKAAMRRGLGRCVIAVKQDPEKYRQAVLWACGRCISYDPQCEGTRAWYVYTMASCYPDMETFVHTAVEALKKYRPNGSWNLLYLSELLMHFASDGNTLARMALEEKYRELLAGMHARKRRPNRVFHELSDLENLGLVLSDDHHSFLRIAGDFGCLYREKQYMLDGDFAWFFASKGDQYKKAMEHAAQKNADIACFLEREQASIAAMEAYHEQRKDIPPEQFTGIRLSHWLAKADIETVARYAAAYRREQDSQKRAQALEAFARCPYPDDPLPIIRDTQSTCEELQNTAWRALEQIRHSAVREFALVNTSDRIRTPENFALLVTNYTPADAPLLEKLLRERIISEDWNDVHTAGLDILRAFRRNSKIPHPKHLLPLLYEYTPCSCCREETLQYLSKHRMLTSEILEECQYDSNDDIRRYAAKRVFRSAIK